MISSKTDRRRARSTNTRRQLLERSAALFATRGFEGTSLDALSEASGVNKALVSYHFGGKQGLYSEVLRSAIREGQAILEPVRNSVAPPPARLAQFIDAMFTFTASQPTFASLVLREEMSGGAHFEPEVMQEFMGFFQVDRDILQDGMKQGVFRPVDPHATHLSLIGSLVFFLVTEPLRQAVDPLPAPSVERRAYFEHVKDLFLRGLCEKDSQP